MYEAENKSLKANDKDTDKEEVPILIKK